MGPLFATHLDPNCYIPVLSSIFLEDTAPVTNSNEKCRSADLSDGDGAMLHLPAYID